MYTRMTPYLTGMYASYVHHKDDGTFFDRQSPVAEWLAFATILIIGTFFSASPAVWPTEKFPAPWYYIYFNMARPFYGLSLSYLLTLILTSKQDEPIGCCRPSGWMRGCLSSNFWLPWATISYSLYLFQMPWLEVIDWVKPDVPGDLKGQFNTTAEWYMNSEGGCGPGPWETFGFYQAYFWLALLLSSLNAVCCFICVEKPGIDARFVYKNKFELEKIKQKRVEWLKRHGKQD